MQVPNSCPSHENRRTGCQEAEALPHGDIPAARMEVKGEQDASSEKLRLNQTVYPYLRVGRGMRVTEPKQHSIGEWKTANREFAE